MFPHSSASANRVLSSFTKCRATWRKYTCSFVWLVIAMMFELMYHHSILHFTKRIFLELVIHLYMDMHILSKCIQTYWPLGIPSAAGRQWWTDQPVWQCEPCAAPTYTHTSKLKFTRSFIHYACMHVSTIVNAVQFKHSAHTLYYTYIRTQVH